MSKAKTVYNYELLRVGNSKDDLLAQIVDALTSCLSRVPKGPHVFSPTAKPSFLVARLCRDRGIQLFSKSVWL
jgi:hypothetical protein